MTLELFEGDMEATCRWLPAPQTALGGETPIEYASTELQKRFRSQPSRSWSFFSEAQF